MTEESASGCADRRLLIQADQDGELDAAAAASLATHVAECAACAALRDRLAELSVALRTTLPRHAAPEALRARLRSQIVPTPPPRRRAGRRLRPVRRLLAPFGAGAAIAACLVLLLVPVDREPDSDLVGLHLRALQPGHLTDVLSTDQHTVKPWFDGRIDFAPNVKDLAVSGYPLVGGRLDALAGRPAAVLVYGHGKHLIDVVVQQQADTADPSGARDGYAVVGWADGGLRYRAISDLSPADLDDFARLWRAAP